MSEFGTFNDISNLSSLLNESRLSNESEKFSQAPVAVTPSNIVIANNQSTNLKEEKRTVDPKEIWATSEILTEEELIDWKDERPAPKYQFCYKQTVGTEDTILGMSEKTPLTSDCTHLVIKIHFPKSSMKELDLDVTKNRLKASSKTHNLFTYLPVNVDSENGNAKFDKEKEVLTITLPIISEY